MKEPRYVVLWNDAWRGWVVFDTSPWEAHGFMCIASKAFVSRYQAQIRADHKNMMAGGV